MVKWDTSTVVAWVAAATATGKVIFDYATGKKDRDQKTDLAEHQIESTERIDLTKILKESLDSLRQDVIRLERKSADNENAWLTQAKENIELKRDLTEAQGEISILKKSNVYYEGLITQYQAENVELRSQVIVLTSHVTILQADNYRLGQSITSMQKQVNLNSEAIIMDVMPVGAPEMILQHVEHATVDKFKDRELATGE